jgi:hypothetical protein
MITAQELIDPSYIYLSGVMLTLNRNIFRDIYYLQVLEIISSFYLRDYSSIYKNMGNFNIPLFYYYEVAEISLENVQIFDAQSCTECYDEEYSYNN